MTLEEARAEMKTRFKGWVTDFRIEKALPYINAIRYLGEYKFDVGLENHHYTVDLMRGPVNRPQNMPKGVCSCPHSRDGYVCKHRIAVGLLLRLLDN